MFTHLTRYPLLVVLLFTIAGCASTPEFDLKGVDQSVSPEQAAQDLDKYKGRQVLWGGMIINSVNTQRGTQFEMLAYPLSSRLKPQVDEKALGRFIATSSQYYETYDYNAGKLLSIVGRVQDSKQGKVGDASYTYPVIHIDQIHLWSNSDSASSIHFGFGVILHN